MTRTGSRWKVLASLRTASGHVALTDDVLSTGNRQISRVSLTHHRLTLRRGFRGRYDVAYVIFEPLVKHAIGFVQDEIVDSAGTTKVSMGQTIICAINALAKIAGALLHQIQYAPGGADNDTGGHPVLSLVRILEHAHLRVLGHTTEDGHARDVERLAQRQQRLVRLDCQLTRRRDDKRGHRRLAGLGGPLGRRVDQAAQGGDTEGECFAAMIRSA